MGRDSRLENASASAVIAGAAAAGGVLAESAVAAASALDITVDLVFASAPHELLCLTLKLPAGSTALQAWLASGWAERWGQQLGHDGPDGLRLGLWGRLCEPATVLQTGDRLELLRPLALSAMDSRRQRLRRDGLRKPARRSPRSTGKPSSGKPSSGPPGSGSGD